MHINIVLTLSGPDRIGIVETVTGMLLDHGGNVETSRMARLGGEFAILMLVSMPSEKLDAFEKKIDILTAQGYKVTTTPTGRPQAGPDDSWGSCRIEVIGADHEGIIHQVARYLSERGINIESMDTETTRAPVSGSPLFTMTATVAVPPGLTGRDWVAALEGEGRLLNVEIKVSESTKE
jgi:glycine cleavage system transcriptional repressor